MKSAKVLFVIDRIGFLELLSIPALSAVVKRAGHRVKVFEFGRDKASAVREAQAWGPDVVAYSVCSNEADRYLGINKVLKERMGFVSVFGGPHPTFFPEFVKRDMVDAICRGEGDVAFPLFLAALGHDAFYSVPNFSFQLADGTIVENEPANLVKDLDTLPFPDRDLIYSKNRFLAESPIKSFFAGRGCPFKCTYCFNHAYHTFYQGRGQVVRTKSVSYLIQEIKEVAAKYPLKFIKFQDDVLGLRRSWLEEFTAVYPREIGLPFMCYARPNMVSATYAKLLKKAGCYSICMAIESGSERIRQLVLGRRLEDSHMLRAATHLKEFGIRIYTVNMVGLPGETEEEIIQTLNLNQKAGVDFADASIFQPYPGTKITDYCKQIGLLDDGKESFESQFTCSVLNFTPEFKGRIETIHRLFSIMVDHPWVMKFYPAIASMQFLRPFLNFLYRFYYGVNLHRRIYMAQIPLLLRLRGALPLLFSRNRV
jgi:anaerobic magnesium-protoporphyrin IX monomethyl ester cyclase